MNMQPFISQENQRIAEYTTQGVFNKCKKDSIFDKIIHIIKFPSALPLNPICITTIK